MRIAIVNDMRMAIEAIRRVIKSVGRHELAWVALNGREAVQKCAEDTPDMILMDLIMPELDGVATTAEIMAKTPCAILLVTASVGGNRDKVFRALSAGALDAVDTPILGTDLNGAESKAFIVKMDQIARLLDLHEQPKPAFPKDEKHHFADYGSSEDFLIAIGASAGGPAALVDVLKVFPSNFPASVVLLQHLDTAFSRDLAEWLDAQISLPVVLAQQNSQLERGTVFLAWKEDHLALSRTCHFNYTQEPKNYNYRPSSNVFFESIVSRWKRNAVGVVLTGMGRDGAVGLKSMRDAGFWTIAQDEKSSAVYGMPKAAAKLGAAKEILPLDEIGPRLVQLVKNACAKLQGDTR